MAGPQLKPRQPPAGPGRRPRGKGRGASVRRFPEGSSPTGALDRCDVGQGPRRGAGRGARSPLITPTSEEDRARGCDIERRTVHAVRPGLDVLQGGRPNHATTPDSLIRAAHVVAVGFAAVAAANDRRSGAGTVPAGRDGRRAGVPPPPSGAGPARTVRSLRRGSPSGSRPPPGSTCRRPAGSGRR
ncbi:hexameric tyrosine-coordinated heme protein [Streptacidiphilus sp. ASG 303]|uniref:hexameric tyrosine-coordinated heme protein n=1 Tax=Streptacidiphilus sp. ASG 303 TaxID=2896847 RepID=UPI0035B0C87B